MIVFSTSAARAWAHEGPFLAAEYAIEEFQLLAAGAILDLYDAAVEAHLWNSWKRYCIYIYVLYMQYIYIYVYIYMYIYIYK